MAEPGKKLGRLSLAILENFVEGVLGEKFVNELRAPTNRELAIVKGLEEAENLFVSKFENGELLRALFVDLEQKDRPALKIAVGKYFDHPTDPSLRLELQKILFEEFRNVLSKERIDRAVDLYIDILTEELAFADKTFQDNVRTLADLHGEKLQREMVELLKRIEGRQFHHEPFLPIAPNKLLGDIPPAKTERYIHRGKIEDNVRDLLRNGGVGAIVGVRAPGGLGKTELAKHAAKDLKSTFEDVMWVNINEKTAPQVVTDMLLQCGIQTQPNDSYAIQKNQLRSWLQNHRLLIIFDDLRENALKDLVDILPPKPCSALITSRINDIASIPKTFPLDVMNEAQALELFTEVLGNDAVSSEKETLQALAIRCKYNPLALEISSHRILQMKDFDYPAKLYLDKVEKHFEALHAEGDSRWDMAAVFDLSYFDLNETDRSRFHKLAAFHNTGFAPTAAAFMWETNQTEADNIISRFVNLSLLKTVPGKVIRYRLHDLLDEYAELKLSQSGDEIRAGNALAKWLVNLFDDHFTDDQTNAPEVKLELENLERSAERLISQKNGNGLANITRAARNWLVVLGYYSKWGYWSDLALSFGIEDPWLKANVLQAIGDVQQFRKEMDAALDSYNEALKLFRQVGAKLGEANTYLSLGRLKSSENDLVGARSEFQNSLAIYKLIGDQYSQARAFYRLGDIFVEEEKYEDAMAQYEQARLLWKSIGLDEMVENILNPRIEEAQKHL